MLVAAVVLPSGAAVAAGDGCGASISRSSGHKWHCTFADNFDGNTLDQGKWSALTTRDTTLGGPDCKVDDPRTIAVHNGHLNLSVRRIAQPMSCTGDGYGFNTRYISGGVTTSDKFSQTYGRFEARIAMPDVGQGLHGAFWTWPQSNKARYGDASGEIDVVEHWTGVDYIVPAVHYKPAGDPSSGGKVEHCVNTTPGRFHTYTAVWTPKTVTFSYDGDECLRVNWHPAKPLVKPAPLDEPFFMSLTTQFSDPMQQWLFRDAPLPGTMKVDYVRVWK